MQLIFRISLCKTKPFHSSFLLIKRTSSLKEILRWFRNSLRHRSRKICLFILKNPCTRTSWHLYWTLISKLQSSRLMREENLTTRFLLSITVDLEKKWKSQSRLNSLLNSAMWSSTLRSNCVWSKTSWERKEKKSRWWVALFWRDLLRKSSRTSIIRLIARSKNFL